VPADPPQARPGKALETREAARDALETMLGGEEKIFSFTKERFRYDVLVNAEILVQHIDLARSPFVPFLPEAMENPFEVWLSFEKHRGTGQVVLRQRIAKGIQVDKQRHMVVVAQSKNGIMEAWTMIPTTDLQYVNRQRQGKLIWAR
jgi:hypothetical protein